MATRQPRSPHRRPARALDESRNGAILRATLAELSECGYDRLTVDAVAARARASKATIYRRWSTKAEMVVDAVRIMKPGPDYADTGSLRGDLISGLLSFYLEDDNIGVVLGLVGAMPRHPELQRVFEEQFLSERSVVDCMPYQRAIDRGEIPAECNPALLVAVHRGVLVTRLLFSTRGVDRDFIIEVIDDVLLPLAMHPPPPARKDSTTSGSKRRAQVDSRASGDLVGSGDS